MSDKNDFLSSMVQALMRLFFRLLYHSFSWTYDWVASTVSVGRWNSWVIESAKLLAGKRVLELGFGPGHLQLHLAAAGWEVYGVDESRQMTHRAGRRLRKANLPSRISRGIAQKLPFPDQSFDSVVATFPTLYIVDPDTLAEIKRVLKPGGRLVVLMASWLTGKSLKERMMSALSRSTGQVPDEHQDIADFTAPYLEAGLQARLRFVNTPGSRLLFILAAKK
jgi:ubiquinone/menaquinone biosynthesis C-methylase UbiE